MFQYFPKINYSFSGGTFEVTDLFRSVDVTIDNQNPISNITSLPGERPDQISSRLYNRPDYYWSLFLINGVKNPFKQWAQTQESYIEQIENEYSGWVYQFANTSPYIPTDGSTGFTGEFLNHYNGVDLDGILPGDLVIYENGSGPYSIKCFGAGGVTSEQFCGAPQYGQSLIPDEFDQQNNIKQVTGRKHITACLDNSGYVYAWGEDIGLDQVLSGKNMNTRDRLLVSPSGGYTFIHATEINLLACKSDGGIDCFGNCTYNNLNASNFNNSSIVFKKIATYYHSETGFLLDTDGQLYRYGYAASIPGITGITYNDVACGYNFGCAVISDGGLTCWGSNDAGQATLPTELVGVTGFVSVAANFKHALALKNDGTVYGWGLSSDGQLNIPSGTYSSISAGRYHSAAIDTNGNFVGWGKILNYGESLCSGQTYEKAEIVHGISGQFNKIASGYEHIILKGSGINNKYVGVVDSVDTLYKRIFVKTYQFSNTNSIAFNDPTGTIVAVWRYNNQKSQYEEVKTIQNKLLSIQKYLDSTLYVNLSGFILDPSNQSDWENIYIADYKNAETDERFITKRKQLMDIDLYNKTQIKRLSLNGVQTLERNLIQLLQSNDTIQIKTSEL